MTLFSPVPPALQTQGAFPFGENAGSEPFNRRVTRTLGTALAAFSEAAVTGVSTGNLSAFETHVPDGVSADLCEALAMIKDCKLGAQLDIGIGWAPARPPIDPPPSRHEFSRDSLEQDSRRCLR